MNSVFTGEVRRDTYWEALPFAIGIIHLFFLASCEFRTVIRILSTDPNYAIENFTTMLSGLLCAIKGMRIWFWRKELHGLLRGLGVMWNESHLPVKIRHEILQSARETNTVGKYYGIMIATVIISYIIQPYVDLLHHHMSHSLTNESFDYAVTIYPTTYPFSTHTLIRFIMCVTWEQCIATFGGLYWMTADSLFAQLTTHTAIQFRILCYNLESIAAGDAKSGIQNDKKLIHHLSKISNRHHELYMYCKMIEKIFNPIIFLMMMLTAANLCFCVFRLDKELSRGNWEEVFKNLAHVAILIIQAVVYCGYADTLTQQSKQILRSAYNSHWTEYSKQLKMLILIIMMRSQKEFKCTAYGIFAVNLLQITSIANTAASYFALLKTMT